MDRLLVFRFCGDWLGYRYRDLSPRVLSGLPSLSLLNSCSMKKPGCASQIDQEYLQHNKLIATGKPMSRVGHHPEEKAAKLSRFISSLASSDPLLRTRKRLDSNYVRRVRQKSWRVCSVHRTNCPKNKTWRIYLSRFCDSRRAYDFLQA